MAKTTRNCDLSIEKALDKALTKLPRFMHPDFSLIQTWDDLVFQIEHEIDLGKEGDTDPKWTSRQTHAAKMYAGNVYTWRTEWEQKG